MKRKRKNQKRERAIMLCSSVLVLTALTMTGIYVKEKNRGQDDGYVVDLINQSVEVDADTLVYTDRDGDRVKLDDSLKLCGNMITIVNNSGYDFIYSFQTNNGTINPYKVYSGKHVVLAFNKDSVVVIVSIVKAN